MFVYIICVVVLLQHHGVQSSDSCTTRVTCQECIRDPDLCVWCAKDDFNDIRCKSQSTFTTDWCPEQLQNPENSVNASQNLNFSYETDRIIQIKPQKYKMKLRPGQPGHFNFSFQGAKDFPVDLYFLLDSSSTMAGIKNVTAEQSENIYKALKKLTKNVHLGFGTFVDKKLFPFIQYMSTNTYSFRHHLPLTDNFTKFKETIQSTPNGENRDPQEGGLDALAQIMACKDLMGWRNESRKIIIFLTDGPYHAAGHGRPAGLFEPYDGKCYTQNETYTKELTMDYPSVGMINKLAVENNMIIFFFIEYHYEFVYRELSRVITGSRLATFYRENNSKSGDDTIVKSLKDIYEKISKKITLNVKSKHRNNLYISFKPDCISKDSGKECDIEVGEEKHFSGTVTLLKYRGQDKIDVDIGVESIGEKLTLEIDVIKNCECENKISEKSPLCYGEKRICGLCQCSENRHSDGFAINPFNDNTTCVLEGTGQVCSGHGICVCGKCQCDEGYNGQYCNCDMISCRLGNGMVCSGETHGKCVCGQCVCEPNWKGSACECPNSDCLDKVGRVCNNRGDCRCGGCKCHDIADWDARTVQDENCRITSCSNCHDRQCSLLENCALCRLNGENCDACDSAIKIRKLKTLPEEYLNSTLWNICQNLRVDIACYTSFAYQYDNENNILLLVVQEDANCAQKFYYFGGGCLALLILIGLATLLCWKIGTEIRDRQEYKQFMSKNMKDSGSVNPLYIQPSNTFKNPAFRKRSFKS